MLPSGQLFFGVHFFSCMAIARKGCAWVPGDLFSAISFGRCSAIFGAVKIARARSSCIGVLRGLRAKGWEVIPQASVPLQTIFVSLIGCIFKCRKDALRTLFQFSSIAPFCPESSERIKMRNKEKCAHSEVVSLI